ncbi:MAG: AMP-binding protein, partial [Deltaproteobacteria bacterium]|nr:AMP-binding protein [Deltaproteobacteria bacterium]
MGLYDFTIYDVITRNARCFTERPAWLEVSDGREITFGQFKDMVDHLAKGLQDVGLKKGDRIGILGKNSLEYFLLYGAASALGLIVIAINWRLSADEAANNLADGTPRLVFADPEFQELIQGLKDKLTTVEKYYNLSGKEGSFEDFSQLFDNNADFIPEEVATDDSAVIIHTAAVEGKPRGALVTHRNILSATTQFAHVFKIYNHVGGLFIAMTAFHAGALNINVSRFDADQSVDLIQEKKITMLFDFAPILASILDSKEKSGKDISSLRVVYGQTEVSALVTISPYNEKPGSAGRPLPLADVRLFDDYDKEVETGQVGEIVVRGPMVFKGYWNLPEETSHTFREGWHHTGDQGRFDEEGFLWYAGRKAEKELIKPGGENVYPAEVEKVILQHPAVERTVVFGVPDPKWKEGIKAVCELKEGQSLEPQKLIDFVG